MGCSNGGTVKFRQDLSMERTRERAAFETGCPKEQIATSRLGGGNIGVEACGKRLVYVVDEGCITDSFWNGYTRASAKQTCTPVLNSESTRVSTPP
jgi:hypothetical protein